MIFKLSLDKWHQEFDLNNCEMAQTPCHKLCCIVIFHHERNYEAFLIFLINTGQRVNERTISEFIYALTCNFQKIYLGNVNDDLGFEYEEETSVRYGCSATLHDEFWYFGGLDTTLRQVSDFALGTELNYVHSFDYKNDWYFQASKIVNCELKRQSDLEFDFYGGSCNSFTHPEPKILLCFDYEHSKECHT